MIGVETLPKRRGYRIHVTGAPPLELRPVRPPPPPGGPAWLVGVADHGALFDLPCEDSCQSVAAAIYLASREAHSLAECQAAARVALQLWRGPSHVRRAA